MVVLVSLYGRSGAPPVTAIPPPPGLIVKLPDTPQTLVQVPDALVADVNMPVKVNVQYPLDGLGLVTVKVNPLARACFPASGHGKSGVLPATMRYPVNA